MGAADAKRARLIPTYMGNSPYQLSFRGSYSVNPHVHGELVPSNPIHGGFAG